MHDKCRMKLQSLIGCACIGDDIEAVAKCDQFWTEYPREDGRNEWKCEHGVGHGNHIHGCDGCCSRGDFPGRLTKNKQSKSKSLAKPKHKNLPKLPKTWGKVDAEAYNKAIQQVIRQGEQKNWGIDKTFIEMLETARKYKVSGAKRRKNGE
jgi:hypothetical protein